MYDLDQLKFIVHEAHRLHMKVAVHAVSQEGIIECIKAGLIRLNMDRTFRMSI